MRKYTQSNSGVSNQDFTTGSQTTLKLRCLGYEQFTMESACRSGDAAARKVRGPQSYEERE
jgi:hypothetical protein